MKVLTVTGRLAEESVRRSVSGSKYDVDVPTDSTANGYVLLDGTSVQTHSLTGTRNTRRRLITSNNGERCSHRVSGSGPIKIYAIESQ